MSNYYDRKTLRNYFSQGALPTTTHFEHLVNSTLNMRDDGFSRSPENGVEIRLVGDTENLRRLISFFGDSQLQTPTWAMTCASTTSNLNFVYTAEPDHAAGWARQQGARPRYSEYLTLSARGNVGINVPEPECRLDVDGALRSTGRFGKRGTVPADGQWHDVIPPRIETDSASVRESGDSKDPAVMTGCHALEIMAGVGLAGAKKGRYALLHAVAMNTYNPTGFFFNFFGWKNRIRSAHAYYLSRADRLKLRWVRMDDRAVSGPDSHKYKLQLKTASRYDGASGSESRIDVQYWITELWFDPLMRNCRREARSE